MNPRPAEGPKPLEPIGINGLEAPKTEAEKARDAAFEAQKAERAQAQIEVIPPLASEVALVGDSIGTGIESALNKLDKGRHNKIGKRGMLAVGGVRTDAGADTISSQIDKVDSTKFPYLVIQGGTNDIGYSSQNPDPRAVARKLINLYRQALAKQPPFKKVMLITIPPHKDMPAYTDKKGGKHAAFDWETRVRACNDELRKLAASEGINLFDLYSECMKKVETNEYRLPGDGVHPGPKEYKIIADMLVTGLTGGKYDPSEAPRIAAQLEAQAVQIEKENPAKAVHLRYLKTVLAGITEKPEADDEFIKKASVQDIRKKARLLNTKNERELPLEQITGLKDETARRLRAYTSTRDNEWYTLDYMKFGADSKGTTHEMNVGLGDILVDNDVKEVLIKRSTGEIVKGRKQIITSGPHKGRVGYADESGRYIATYTGDKFRILSDKETDLKNATEVEAYIKESKEHDTARETAEIETSEGNYGTGPEGIQYTGENTLDAKKSVAEQLMKKLTGPQREAAKIIEEEFIKAGLTEPNLIAAAIVNSWHESKLNPGIIASEYDRQGKFIGYSVGLFQLYDKGAGLRNGKLMSKEERQDPRINTQRIIEDIKSKEAISRLIAKAKAGASIQELTRLFCIYIEVPRDPELKGKERARASLAFFPRKQIEANDTLIATKDRTARGKTIESTLKPRQDIWYVGSSSSVILGNLNKDPSIGTFGVGGAGPEEVLGAVKELFANLNKNALPKRVVLVGMCVNGLSTNGSVDRTVEENLRIYRQIAQLFEEANVEVKISPAPLYGPKKQQIAAFNKALKNSQEYSKYYINTGAEQYASMHLPDKGYRNMMQLEKASRMTTTSKMA